MKEKNVTYKYLIGIASGRFQSDEYGKSDTISYRNITIDVLEVKEVKVSNEFDLNSLEYGMDFRPSRTIKDVNIYTSEKEYTRQDLDDFILQDVRITDEVTVDGDSFYKFESSIYFILSKEIEKINNSEEDSAGTTEKPLYESSTESVKKENTSESTGKTYSASSNKDKVNADGQQSNAESQGTQAKKTSFSNRGCFKPFITFLLSYLFFSWVFGSLFSVSWWSFIPILIIALLYYFLDKRKSKNVNLGVHSNWLNFIGWGVLLYGLYSLFGTSTDLLSSICIVAIGLGLILGSRVGGMYSRIGKLIAVLSIGILVYLNYNLDLNWDFDFLKDDNQRESKYDKEEYVEDDVEIIQDTVLESDGQKRSVNFLSHKLSWKDNSSNAYSTVLKVRKDYYHLSSLNRNKIEPRESDFISYFHHIYLSLVQQNKKYLNDILASFKKIGTKNKLNRERFADMIVTAIQNIPYYLVHDLTHREADRTYGGFISEYHRTGQPCLDQVKFGLQSPTEFMGNFKGDCDTRSVLLFYLLSKFGYKVMVLGSERYGHAIIAVAGNYKGSAIRYKGLKYYVWETTATGFVPGSLSSQCSNLRYWNIILTN